MKSAIQVLAILTLLALSPALSGQDSVSDVEAGAAADSPASDTPVLDAADLESWLDGFMAATLESSKIAGAVVSVVKDGELLLSRGYGYADVEAEQPMDPATTLMRVGSTSKVFTWTAVMQLVEQGKLELDRDVNEYLDFEIPSRSGPPVTMNDLMTHRGGFEEGLREVLMTDPDRFITTEKYLKEHPRPRIFEAGQIPAYSNYGTALAGYIVERVSGVPFDDYIDRYILAPLEMNHSTFRQPLPETLQADMSRGYMTDDQPPRDFELVTTAPAGSLSATADDMAHFMIAHLQEGAFQDRRILQAKTARKMYSATYPQQPGFATMAHGFFSAMDNGRHVLGHGGDTVVFHTDMNLLPDEGVGFFVSFNSRGARDAVYGIRSRLFEQFMDRYYPAPDLPELPPAIEGAARHAQELAGSYESSRRIETAFLGLLYLLQQSKVAANPDGTISFSSAPDRKFRETAPGIWRDEEGETAVHVTSVDGRQTIATSGNPSSVSQRAPASRSATLNLYVMMGSLAVLAVVVLFWPIGWFYRRRYNQPPQLSGRPLIASRLTRLAALAVFVYLFGWFLAFQPIIQNDLHKYGPDFDGLLRTLQIAAIVPLGGVVIGGWNAWLSLRSERRWTAKIGNILVALAFLGVAWLAWAGRLMGFNLEY